MPKKNPQPTTPATQPSVPVTAATSEEKLVSAVTKRKVVHRDDDSFACYIRRALRNAGGKDTVYRIDHQLLNVLDQFMARYIDTVARQSQNSLDIMHLKHLNISTLKYTLDKVTPTPLCERVLESVDKMSKAFEESRPDSPATTGATKTIKTKTK